MGEYAEVYFASQFKVQRDDEQRLAATRVYRHINQQSIRSNVGTDSDTDTRGRCAGKGKRVGNGAILARQIVRLA